MHCSSVLIYDGESQGQDKGRCSRLLFFNFFFYVLSLANNIALTLGHGANGFKHSNVIFYSHRAVYNFSHEILNILIKRQTYTTTRTTFQLKQF